MVPFAASNLPHFGDTTNVKKAIFIIKFIIADVKLKKMIIVMIFVVITFSYPQKHVGFLSESIFPPYWNNFHNVLSKFDNVVVLMVPISSWISTSSNLFANLSELLQTCRWWWHRIFPLYSTYFYELRFFLICNQQSVKRYYLLSKNFHLFQKTISQCLDSLIRLNFILLENFYSEEFLLICTSTCRFI